MSEVPPLWHIEQKVHTNQFREDVRACIGELIAKDKFSMEDNVDLAILYAIEIERQLKERGRL